MSSVFETCSNSNLGASSQQSHELDDLDGRKSSSLRILSAFDLTVGMIVVK